ncbi:MAG: response regulator transcription factor [Hyphomicrobiales bacterium]
MTAAVLRVVVADDSALYRKTICNLLQQKVNLQVVAEAEDGLAAVRAVEKYRPDVVLMDISMPGVDGIDATSIIRSKFPQVRVIILSMHDGNSFAKAAYQAGAFWYLSKGCSPKEIIQALMTAGI